MHGKINWKNIFLVIISFGFGIGVFYYIYKGQDWKLIFDSIKKSDYYWLFVSALLGLSSHLSRAIRWKLLIKPYGYNPRISSLFYSVMGMYFINLGIPRAGEIFRCSFVSKKENIPFSFLLGTIITERIIDIIFLLLLIITAFALQFKIVIKFFTNHPQALEKLQNLIPYLIILAVLGFFMLVFLFIKREKIKKLSLYQKFKQSIENFINGIKSVANLDKKWQFIAHSFFIWTMYFVMIYVCFKAFPFTSELNILAGLMVFVMASLGMVAPSPGGLGPWHAMAIATLYLYGIDQASAKIFAFATHGIQTLMIIFVGGFSLIALYFLKNKNSKIETSKIKNYE